MRVQSTLTTLLIRFVNKKNLKIKANAWGKYWILYHKTNKEACALFCCKALGSGDST